MRFFIDELGPDFIENHFFVPAGRSFYANLGKAVAMLEHGSRLDIVTTRFGRRYTSQLDGGAGVYMGRDQSTRNRDIVRRHKALIDTLMGGVLKMSTNDSHLQTRDGRIIPFSLMSSGQQELLPLLLSLQEYLFRNILDKDPSVDLLYIEEPEAHLFPSSQSNLTQHIVYISNLLSRRSRMFVTTHSPYVLTSLNNMILAAQVGGMSEQHADRVNRVIPRDRWLNKGRVTAYAIEDGVCQGIIDESGLIDGEYLDKVSSHISDEFSHLLEIEMSGTSKHDS